MYKNLIILGSIIAVLGFGYVKYNQGIDNAYNKGITEERNRQTLIQTKVLEKVLIESKENQEIAYQQGISSVKKEKEIQIVYKEKIEIVEKIVEVNPNLGKDVCKLPDEEFEKMKELLK